MAPKVLANDLTVQLVDALFGDSEQNFQWAIKSMENIINSSSELLRQFQRDKDNDENFNAQCLINLNFYDSSIKKLFLNRIQNNSLNQEVLVNRLLKISYYLKNISLIEIFDFDILDKVLFMEFVNLEQEFYCFKILMIIQCCYPEILQNCSRIEFLDNHEQLVQFINHNIKLDFKLNVEFYDYFIEYYLNLYYLTPFQDDKLKISSNLVKLTLQNKIRDAKFKDYLLLKILMKVDANFEQEDFNFFIAPCYESLLSYFLSLPIYYASNSSNVFKEEELKVYSRRILYKVIQNDITRLRLKQGIDLSKYDYFIKMTNCLDIDLIILVYANLEDIVSIPSTQELIIFYNKILLLIRSFVKKLILKSKLPKNQTLMINSYDIPNIKKFVGGIMSGLSISNEKLYDVTEEMVEMLLEDTVFYKKNFKYIFQWIRHTIGNLKITAISIQTLQRLITNLNDCLEIIIDQKYELKVNSVELIQTLISINNLITKFDKSYVLISNNISYTSNIVEILQILSSNITKILSKFSPIDDVNNWMVQEYHKIKPNKSKQEFARLEKIKDKELNDTMKYIENILNI